MIPRTVLVCLATLLLAAHFLRWGNALLVAVTLILPCLLLIRRRWALRTVQVALACGAAIWLTATYRFIRMRIALGEPWGRLALILGAVIIVTLTAAVALDGTSIRDRYPRRQDPST
ncbi:MAG: hypothetical protein P8Y44_02765 [Acidobacteriota bacterium]